RCGAAVHRRTALLALPRRRPGRARGARAAPHLAADRLGRAAAPLIVMAATAIIGTQWGDEGKGKVVDLLAARADMVVRYHGGNNAGHTLAVKGQKTRLNLIPSGGLHPGKVCVLGAGMVIDPAVLVREIGALRARGYLAEDRWLRVSDQAHLI